MKAYYLLNEDESLKYLSKFQVSENSVELTKEEFAEVRRNMPEYKVVSGKLVLIHERRE